MSSLNSLPDNVCELQRRYYFIALILKGDSKERHSSWYFGNNFCSCKGFWCSLNDSCTAKHIIKPHSKAQGVF